MKYDIIYSHNANKSEIYPPKAEILRYMGQKDKDAAEIDRIVDSLIFPTLDKATARGAFVMKRCNVTDNALTIGHMCIKSKNLVKNLGNCNSVILFSLTIGAEVDRFITSKSAVSPLEALTVSATATAITEEYADVFCRELKSHFQEEGLYLKPRFSPGYGDFSLEFQQYILSETDASRRCGIDLTEALVLTPSKSVTGIMGICHTKYDCPLSGCEVCIKTDCKYRRNS